MPQCQASLSVTGGSLIFSPFDILSSYTLYGNNVTRRQFTANSLSTFIDLERPLHTGVLRRYFLYAHPSSAPHIVRIQIWRPVNTYLNPNFLYLLVWERRVQLSAHTDGFFYTVDGVLLNLVHPDQL